MPRLFTDWHSPTVTLCISFHNLQFLRNHLNSFIENVCNKVNIFLYPTGPPPFLVWIEITISQALTIQRMKSNKWRAILSIWCNNGQLFWAASQMFHQSNDLHAYYWHECTYCGMKQYLRREVKIHMDSERTHCMCPPAPTQSLFWQLLNINHPKQGYGVKSIIDGCRFIHSF